MINGLTLVVSLEREAEYSSRTSSTDAIVLGSDLGLLMERGREVRHLVAIRRRVEVVAHAFQFRRRCRRRFQYGVCFFSTA